MLHPAGPRVCGRDRTAAPPPRVTPASHEPRAASRAAAAGGQTGQRAGSRLSISAVAGFVGTSNVIERSGRRYMVRPVKIRFLTGGETDAAAAEGTVREVAYLGPVARYEVELDGGRRWSCSDRASTRLPPRPRASGVGASVDGPGSGWLADVSLRDPPMIATALVAGGLLAFALSFDEIVVTTFTAGAQSTLPIWIFGNIRLGQQLPQVNVVVLFVIVVSLVPVALARRLTRDTGVLQPSAMAGGAAA
jgi:hypothetical protein